MCCSGGACGLSGFGSPLSCNENNICVVSCGVNGTACCTDADFRAVVDAYDDGLYEYGLDAESFPTDVAAADAVFGSVGGCFGTTQCGSGGVCTLLDPASLPDYTYLFGVPLTVYIVQVHLNPTPSPVPA